jgi:hypothetical protein
VRSQALAIFQSRMTLWGEIFNTSAVSSTLSPPKNGARRLLLCGGRFIELIQRFVDGEPSPGLLSLMRSPARRRS